MSGSSWNYQRNATATVLNVFCTAAQRHALHRSTLVQFIFNFPARPSISGRLTKNNEYLLLFVAIRHPVRLSVDHVDIFTIHSRARLIRDVEMAMIFRWNGTAFVDHIRVDWTCERTAHKGSADWAHARSHLQAVTHTYTDIYYVFMLPKSFSNWIFSPLI